MRSSLLSVIPCPPRCDLDSLSRIARHLSTCTERYPSLLARDDAALSALTRACMAMARPLVPIDDDDDSDDNMSSLRLSALEVLSTMCAAP